jgi:mannose-6-phosphate isomerase-like protein (cupin superfamily)
VQAPGGHIAFDHLLQARLVDGGQEFIYNIRLGTTHHLENLGRVDLKMIDVQSGSYLGVDYIMRFEDVYGR